MLINSVSPYQPAIHAVAAADTVEARRLLVVTNRLPFTLEGTADSFTVRPSSGGLVTAVTSYLRSEANASTFREAAWLGIAEKPRAAWKNALSSGVRTEGYTPVPLFIRRELYNAYYNGFCNSTIWPLFHYFPSFAEFHEKDFQAYEEVNRNIADRVAGEAGQSDLIWVHDYHLFMLPDMLRSRAVTSSIGFFLHIPFPAYEVFRLLPHRWRVRLLQGILGADVAGFQTQADAAHFRQAVAADLGEDCLAKGCPLIDTFPIGIDFEHFASMSLYQEVHALADDLQGSFGHRRVILSVDRLDYSKGLTQRLRGFEQFLERHPEWIEKVVYVINVVPSRDIVTRYGERKRMIEERIANINGRFGTLSWQPVFYRYNHLAQHELSALYVAADIAFIVPLRDGMNLVAKEYVASKTRTEGVLILSELAGASEQLGDALLVNPNDEIEIADALHHALTMEPREKQRRMGMMRENVMRQNVVRWAENFVRQMTERSCDSQRTGYIR